MTVRWSASGGDWRPVAEGIAFQAAQPGTYRLTAASVQDPEGRVEIQVVVHDRPCADPARGLGG